MSADNVIYIQDRGGFFWVWMDFMSNDTPVPDGQGAMTFTDFSDAVDYAFAWLQEETVVEYGVRLLEPAS